MVWGESWSSVHDLGNRYPSNILETSGSKHWPHWTYKVSPCWLQHSLNLTPTQVLQLRAVTGALTKEHHLSPPALSCCWRLTAGARGATQQCFFSYPKFTALINWIVLASFKLLSRGDSICLLLLLWWQPPAEGRWALQVVTPSTTAAESNRLLRTT